MLRTIGLLIMLPGALFPAGPSLSYSAPQEPGLRLLIPGSQDFDREFNALAGGVTNDLLVEVLPYSVIVKNDTTRYIAALSIVYRLSDAAGNSIPDRHVLANVMKERARLLGPGQARFICPVSALYHAINHSQAGRGALFSPDMVSIAKSRLSLFLQQQSVHVSLDAVVFENGELIGEDKSKTQATLNSWIRAQNDLSTFAAHSDAREIKTYLESILAKPEKSPSSADDIDHYDSRQRGLARMMLYHIRLSEQVFRQNLAEGEKLLIGSIYRRLP